VTEVNTPLERIRYREPGVSSYIIVGQQPLGNLPDEPLSAQDPKWSGARLARMAGLTPEEYESHFMRVNVNYTGDETFKVNDITKRKAVEIWRTFREGDRVILLGTSVAKCFTGLIPPELPTSLEPVVKSSTLTKAQVAVIPHPSGINRMLNDPSVVAEIGEFLQKCYRHEW